VNLNQSIFYLIGNFSEDPDLYPGIGGVAGKLAYFWKFDNGPVHVNITSPNSPVATFTSIVEGVYIFSLRVYDGQLFDINGPSLVRYTLVNIAPVVSFGQYPYNPVLLGQTVILNATGLVYDPDNSPSPLQLKWQLLAGPDIPGNTINNDDQYVANFTPNVTGYYSVRLYAYDGSKTGIGNYVIIVNDVQQQDVPTDGPTDFPTQAFPPAFLPQAPDVLIPSAGPSSSPTSSPTVPVTVPTIPTAPTPPTGVPTILPSSIPTTLPPVVATTINYYQNGIGAIVLAIILSITVPVVICLLICGTPCRYSARNRYSNKKRKV
jgi:hypothetical protein